YVDRAADLKMAVKILINAKMQRPGVCNSAETVLVHQTVAKRFFKLFLTELGRQKKTLEIRACKRSHAALLANQRLAPGLNLRRASPKDWNTEHLELILNAAVVSSAPAAQRHIATYGSRHSEAIVTKSRKTAEAFLNSVDAAAVYWNASTRFTDGHQLGLGGEIGISTQKLHVRGPVGLEALTCQQWVLRGSGQIRI
ncbi:MAG TPA: hypothetical protein PLH57_06060, partial [Oligoflexia bacterium]|nr:hypothetical protein [Oligoflexia bacterium]